MQTFVLNLGPVRITLGVGDADHNGALDLSLGIKISGSPFEMHFPPFNLDAKFAKEVGDAFAGLAAKIAAKK
jgi:hypothetical protein